MYLFLNLEGECFQNKSNNVKQKWVQIGTTSLPGNTFSFSLFLFKFQHWKIIGLDLLKPTKNWLISTHREVKIFFCLVARSARFSRLIFSTNVKTSCHQRFPGGETFCSVGLAKVYLEVSVLERDSSPAQPVSPSKTVSNSTRIIKLKLKHSKKIKVSGCLSLSRSLAHTFSDYFFRLMILFK